MLRVRPEPVCCCLSLRRASAGCATAALAGRALSKSWVPSAGPHACARGAQVFIGRMDADAPDPAGRLPKASASPAEVQARAMAPCPSSPCVLCGEILRAPCPGPRAAELPTRARSK